LSTMRTERKKGNVNYSNTDKEKQRYGAFRENSSEVCPGGGRRHSSQL